MDDRSEQLDLLASTCWPAPTARAGLIVTTGAPVHVVLSHLKLVRDDVAWRDTDRALGNAVDALSKLPPNTPIGSPRAEDATRSLDILAKALDNLAQSSADSRGNRIRRVVYAEESLAAKVIEEALLFVSDEAARASQSLSTFSLILFRDTDHDGDITESFNNRRAGWMDALRPRSEMANDNHLAIVINPSARNGVRALAQRLGVDQMLPCVTFLGSNLQALQAPSSIFNDVVHRSASVRLKKDEEGYPAQLHAVYDTVYQQLAIMPGSRLSAVADNAFDTVKARVSVSSVLKLFAGALLGGGSVKAIEAAEDLFSNQRTGH